MPFYSRATCNDRKSQRWCFTINNYTGEDIARLQALDCDFLVYGKEVAPKTGTPHLQGYIEFPFKKSMIALANMLRQRAHLEIASGTDGENIEYCTKEGDYWMTDKELLASYKFYDAHPLPEHWTKQEKFEWKQNSNHENWTDDDLKFYIKKHDTWMNYLLSMHDELSRKKLIKKDWEDSK